MKGKELIGRALVAAGITAGGVALESCAPQQQSQPVPITREAQPVPAQQQPPSNPEARIVMPIAGRVFTQTAESALAAPAVPTATPTEPPKPTATASPEPTATPKPEPNKPLPEVINNQTVEFVSPPVEEVQKAVEEAKTKGEIKIPLPDIVKNKGISVVEITNKKTGRKVLAITGDEEGTYTLPSFVDGKVSQVFVGGGNLSGIEIITENNKLGYILPPTATSPLKTGDSVKLGQPVATFSYSPGGQPGQRFIRVTLGQFQDAPKNTIAIISGGSINISKENILTTLQGSIVIAGSP